MDIKVGRDNVQVKWTYLDRVINHVSPTRGQRRLQSRIVYALTGGYTGGKSSRRSMSGWSPRGNDPDGDILLDLPTLRERSRDLVRNTPLATGAINTPCTNVVGSGLKLHSRIDRDVLPYSRDQAKALETHIEREFRLWAESKECDKTRTLTFAGMQNLVFRSTLESGDTFTLLPEITRKGSPYKLKLQIIEADRVGNEDNKIDTDKLSGGVERDEYDAPKNYHIMKQHPGKLFGRKKQEWDIVSAFGNKTGRINVIHLFKVLRPGQTRGVPYLAPVIELFKQLGRYTEAEIMAAVVNSMFTVFIKNIDGGDGLAPMTPSSETGGTASDPDYKLGNGSILDLNEGEEVEFADPKRPSTAFDPFVQALLRQIGVALELPFEVLVKHFTSSYSAARASLLDAWKFFLSQRQWLAANFCQPVYETWFDEAVTSGRISAPGYFSDPIIRKAYLGSEWIGPSKGMIDEKKEVEAAELKVAGGFATRAEVTAEMTGGDWDKKHDQRVKEEEMRREGGLITSTTQPSNNNNNDEDDLELKKEDDEDAA